MVGLIIFAFGGCGSESSRPIADSTMVDVLVEMHILNARIHTTDRPLVGARDSVFHRYGIDSTSFIQMMIYYAEHPDDYADVYGRVVDRLAVERAPIIGLDSLSARPGLPSPSW